MDITSQEWLRMPIDQCPSLQTVRQSGIGAPLGSRFLVHAQYATASYDTFITGWWAMPC
jgi:hypothetical protein